MYLSPQSDSQFLYVKSDRHDSNLEKRCIANCLQSCACRDRQETYCLIQALDKATHKDLENGLFFAGSNAGKADKILPVAELMAELIS